MPIKSVSSERVTAPDGDAYVPDTLYREWIRNPKPYYSKIGPFLSYRMIRRSGLYQDAYWPAGGSIGKSWVVNNLPLLPSSLPVPSADGCFSDNVRRRAIYKLQEEIAKSEFNLAVAGAEAVKTVGLITHTAARLFKAALALKKGRLGDAYRALGLSPKSRRTPKAKKVRENAGNYWLEMQYGWNPLLSDIYGGCRALATMLNQPDVPIFFAEARATDREFSLERVKDGRSTWAVDTDWEVKFQQSCRVGVAFRIRSGEIVQAARLGLTNPALVVWEVVPFSFVVDWFIPVSSFLAQLSAYHGLEFVSGYQTQFYKGLALHRMNNRNPLGMRFSGGGTYLNYMRQRRIKLSSFPYAGLILTDPFKSAKKAVTTLALLQGVLGGFTRKSRT